MILPKHPPTRDDVARHYDELDAFYREVWSEHLHHGLWVAGDETVDVAVRQLVDLVAAEGNVQAGSAVCDVGAGYGAPARHLALDYGARVTALTLSRAQHDYACAVDPGADNPRYLFRDWLENDLPDASFDVVFALESTAHMADKPRFFTEAFRVLRPNGRLVVAAWLADDHPTPRQVRHLLEPICREGRLPGLGTAFEYMTWAENAGFVLDTFTDLSRCVRRTWSVCLLRVLRGLATDRRYLRYLLDARHADRLFLLTMVRLWIAYRTGAFRYGLFAGHKPR